MFRFRKPTPDDLEFAMRTAYREEADTRRFLSLAEGLGGRRLPFGLAHDSLRSRLGHGRFAFNAARQAVARWAEFNLGWVRVANPEIPIAVGQIVAVEVHAAGLRSLNLSRIVETVHTETRFGFLYATTAHHAEAGEERFVLEYDDKDGAVWYHLEAVSRPQHPLARLGYPLTRRYQHRFAQDSHVRMRQAVNN